MTDTHDHNGPGRPALAGPGSSVAIAPDLTGIIITNGSGEPLSSFGSGEGAEAEALVRDPKWRQHAIDNFVVQVDLSDRRQLAYAKTFKSGFAFLFANRSPEVFLRFLWNVPFAYDIIDLILSDPYAGMVVAGADEKVAFISPVHERHFNVRPGEGVGKHVREIIANSQLPRVIKSGIAEIGEVFELKDGARIVSRQPVRRNGEIAGAIGRVMFKRPEQLQDLAQRVSELEHEVERHRSLALQRQQAEQCLKDIVGQSVVIESVRQQIRKVAGLGVSVLIQGESGTGKELVARALHMMGSRHRGRLITVNSAALAPNLVESELFGYEAGSFTGADRKGRQGKFELANQGTIFLDEIGDMPLDMQATLLRVLQERVVERIGSDKPTRVDFRLCSATNHDLEALVEEGKFRLDLYYRISPVRILLPTLDERIEDVPALLHHFLQELSEKYDRQVPEVDIDVPDFLMDRPWPGNVRQLRHEVERALIFAENGQLRVSDFPSRASTERRRAQDRIRHGAGTFQPAETIKDATDALEQRLIQDNMARFKGNKKRVAEQLGISRSYLYKKLEELGMEAGATAPFIAR